MTFDVPHTGDRLPVKREALSEAFCVCRQCRRASIGLFSHQLIRGSASAFRLVFVRFRNLADVKAVDPPEHLPPSRIGAAFEEGAKCLAVQCFNAAGAMFRLCLDLATKDLAPGNDTKKLLLGARLKWLFDNGKLPEGLKELASVVKDDGNDAVHDGSLDKNAAEDLQDFAERLLTQLYTEPARVKHAQARKRSRNAKDK